MCLRASFERSRSRQLQSHTDLLELFAPSRAERDAAIWMFVPGFAPIVASSTN